MQPECGVRDARGNLAPQGSSRQQFDDGRGVEHNVISMFSSFTDVDRQSGQRPAGPIQRP